MADPELVAAAKAGTNAWNAWRATYGDAWRAAHHDRYFDLTEANLNGANLAKADLRGAYLREAHLNGADLHQANLCGAFLYGTYLYDAELSQANLSKADLRWANLTEACLIGADLSGANLQSAILVATNLAHATLDGSLTYGISAWNLILDGTSQKNLVISNWNEPSITVDNIEIAQFIYLLLHNEKIHKVIDTITSKVVLILGRFTAARKAVLDTLRDTLRQRDYLPVLFDFDKPSGRDLTETLSILAHMARFVIADITDATSIPQELQAIVPHLPSVPVQPLLQMGAAEYGMFEHFKRYPWVLQTFHYQDIAHALASLETAIIAPAEQKVKELRP